MIKKYVDDVNVILKAIPTNTRWRKDEKVLETRKEQPIEEYNKKEIHTFEIPKELASSITPGIEFTAETPADHPETMMVPMLDIQTWIHPGDEGDQVRYMYYKKPATSPIVFHGEGSHTWRNKLVVLAQETLRRMVNCDTEPNT